MSVCTTIDASHDSLKQTALQFALLYNLLQVPVSYIHISLGQLSILLKGLIHA